MDSLPPGQTIGPYRIISQIGQGGMATVYKAYHPAMDRYVALKVLPRQLAASREFTGRFEHEARLIAKLEHAHILPVHDYGTADGHTYLAMRFVEAGTLKDRLQAGPLTGDEIDRYFTQLADALDYAHAMGIIHRDLKPSNVLLDMRGNLFLTDFGIAKLLEGSPEFTSTGAMVGTPAYMSPEQAQGQRVDLRTDIYSLGIVLYEMVTGRVPFEADTPLAVILKHLNAPLPLPSSLKADVPPAVERVLLKALAKDSAERFATTGAFIAAWQAARPALRAAATAAASTPAAPLAPALHTVAVPLPVVIPAVAAPPPAATRTPLPTPAAPPPSLPAESAHPGAAAVAPLGAPAPTSLPSAARPPTDSRARLGLLGLAAAVALLLLGVLVCGVIAVTLLRGPLAAGLAPTAPPSGAPTDVLGFVNGGASGWQSWTSANLIQAVALSSDGQLVTGGPGNVTGWDMSTGAPDTQLNGANGLPGPDVYALLDDPDHGLFWIATSDGLVATDGQSLTVYREDFGLDSDAVFALALTSQGLLAGTAYSSDPGSGLNLYTSDGWQRVPGFPSVQAEDDPERLSTTVLSLLEDANGDWWVGTTNGLGRYDGSTWTRYSLDSGLPASGIQLLALVDGEVWAGTAPGVARFNGDAFESVPGLEDWYVTGLLQAASGEVWASLSGGLARRATPEADWEFYEPDNLPSYTIYRGVEAPDGTLYFGTDDGVLRVIGGDRSVWRALNVPSVPSFGGITAGPELGQIWFIEEYGVETDVFDLASETWQPGPVLNCEYCVPLARDADGRLWAGGDLGLWVLDAAGGAMAHLTAENGLPADGVYSVAFAPTGEAWLATPGGVAVYDGESVTAVYDAESAGLASDSVHAVWATSDGALWAATEHGISRLDLSGDWTHFDAGDPFESDLWVNDLAEDTTGAVWLATAGEGVYRYANGAWTNYRPRENAAGLPSAEIRTVTVAPDGSLWFGAYYEGAAHLQGNAWQVFQVEDGLIHSNVNDIFIDEQGAVWFATSGGVSRYQP